MEPSSNHLLRTCLTGIELEKYIPVFETHGVDMEIFGSMNDEDLRYIGIDDVDDINLILKYTKIINKKRKPNFISSSNEEKENGFRNIALQANRIRCGVQYLSNKLTPNNKPIDFLMNDDCSATSYADILLTNLETECNKFAADLKSSVIEYDDSFLIRRLKRRQWIGPCLLILTAVIIYHLTFCV